MAASAVDVTVAERYAVIVAVVELGKITMQVRDAPAASLHGRYLAAYDLSVPAGGL
jgi:hypothetical protein